MMEQDLIGTKKDIEYLREDLTEIKVGMKELGNKFDAHVATMDDRYAKKSELADHRKETTRQIDTLGDRVSKFTGALWVAALALIGGMAIEIVRIFTHT